ncbi:conserved hypothetical protein [delta proteobacterium NaphS2]|nr:conserved hypothetical protein [delta proteobacterium NaphS2]
MGIIGYFGFRKLRICLIRFYILSSFRTIAKKATALNKI